MYEIADLAANESRQVNAMSNDVVIINTDYVPLTISDANGQSIATIDAKETFVMPKGSGVYSIKNSGTSNAIVVIIRM